MTSLLLYNYLLTVYKGITLWFTSKAPLVYEMSMSHCCMSSYAKYIFENQVRIHKIQVMLCTKFWMLTVNERRMA